MTLTRRAVLVPWCAFAFSLLGNVALLFFYFEKSRSHPSTVAEVTRLKSIPPGVVPPPNKEVLTDLRSKLLGTLSSQDKRMWDPKYLAERMRQDGYPEWIILRAVMTAINVRDIPLARQLMGVKGEPRRWNPAPSGAPHARSGLAQLQVSHQEELRAIMGQDSSAIAILDKGPVETVTDQFAGIRPDQVVHVKRLEADYAEIFRDTASKGVISGERNAEFRAGLEAGFDQDLRKILNQQEVLDYYRYNSKAAKTVQKTLSGLDVDETTYNQLVDAALEAHKTSLAGGGGNASLRSEEAMAATYWAVVGDAAFAAVAAKLDPVAASAQPIYQFAGLGYAQQADLFAEAMRFRHATMTSPPDSPAVAAQARALYDLATKPLSEVQRTKFDETELGRTLRSRIAR